MEIDPQEPYYRLALAILAQAVRDLYCNLPDLALDALIFWLEDGEDLLNDVLNTNLDGAEVFTRIVRGGGKIT